MVTCHRRKGLDQQARINQGSDGGNTSLQTGGCGIALSKKRSPFRLNAELYFVVTWYIVEGKVNYDWLNISRASSLFS